MVNQAHLGCTHWGNILSNLCWIFTIIILFKFSAFPSPGAKILSNPESCNMLEPGLLMEDMANYIFPQPQ